MLKLKLGRRSLCNFVGVVFELVTNWKEIKEAGVNLKLGRSGFQGNR